MHGVDPTKSQTALFAVCKSFPVASIAYLYNFIGTYLIKSSKKLNVTSFCVNQRRQDFSGGRALKTSRAS